MQNLIFFKVSVKKKEYENVALQNSGEAGKEVSLCCKYFPNVKIRGVSEAKCICEIVPCKNIAFWFAQI